MKKMKFCKIIGILSLSVLNSSHGREIEVAGVYSEQARFAP
jgi:hypothetical protein